MKFRSQITLQSQTQATAAAGCFTATWGTVSSYWADWSYSSAEDRTNEKSQDTRTVKILIRYDTSLDKKIHRFILDDGNACYIKTVAHSRVGRTTTVIGEVEDSA